MDSVEVGDEFSQVEETGVIDVFTFTNGAVGEVVAVVVDRGFAPSVTR